MSPHKTYTSIFIIINQSLDIGEVGGRLPGCLIVVFPLDEVLHSALSKPFVKNLLHLILHWRRSAASAGLSSYC